MPPPGEAARRDYTRGMEGERRAANGMGRNAWMRSGLALALGLSVASGVAGCGKPLFSSEDPRSQYDRYDRSRNQLAPQYIEDEYGRREPNLRGRLSPKT